MTTFTINKKEFKFHERVKIKRLANANVHTVRTQLSSGLVGEILGVTSLFLLATLLTGGFLFLLAAGTVPIYLTLQKRKDRERYAKLLPAEHDTEILELI